MNPAQSIVIFFLITLGFYSGSAWISGKQALEINQLNAQIKNLETQLQSDFQKRETLNQNIAAKNKTVEAFCKDWRK